MIDLSRDRLIRFERTGSYWTVRGITGRTDYDNPARSLPDQEYMWFPTTKEAVRPFYHAWAVQTAMYSSPTQTKANQFYHALLLMGPDILSYLVDIMIDPDTYVSHPFMLMNEFLTDRPRLVRELLPSRRNKSEGPIIEIQCEPVYIPYEERGRIPMIERRYLNAMIDQRVVDREDLNPNHLAAFETRYRNYVESAGLVLQPPHD